MITECLLAPFEYAFMQRALGAVLLASTACSIVGCFIVLRRMAFISGALTHTLLPGVALAHIFGWIPLFGGLLSSLTTVLGIGILSSKPKIQEDTAIGVLLSGMFALGVLISTYTESTQDLATVLFGSVLSVQTIDLICAFGCTALILSLLSKNLLQIELSSYDPEYAAQVGISTRRIRYLLLILTALSVVIAVEITGALLTTALLIIPAAAASLVTRTLKSMLFGAMLLANISGIAGLYLSFYADLPSGPSIVLCLVCVFAICYLAHSLETKGAKSNSP